MQPWIDKSLSNTNKNSLHFDRTISNLQSSSSHQTDKDNVGSSGFRTQKQGKGKAKDAFGYNYNDAEKPQQQTHVSQTFGDPHRFAPMTTTAIDFNAHEDPLDGSEVLHFLNSGTAYNDHVYGDDLNPDSIAYISHRHQMDTQHAFSEKEKLQHHWTTELLAAEDIVEFLQNATYTEDIYGIPVMGQWIKQAQQEAAQIQQTSTNTTESNQKIAIERLDMIRHHLIQKANGDPNLAAKSAIGMTENDWSSWFS